MLKRSTQGDSFYNMRYPTPIFGFSALFAGLFALAPLSPLRAEECLITVTNLAATSHVPEQVTEISLAGTAASSVTGQLAWAVAETAASGSSPADTEWSIANIPLALGTNTITVSGAGTELPAVSTNAVDHGGDPAYASAWNNGSNGGNGFGSWELSTDFNNPANGGHFMAEGQGNLDVGPRAWGLYANSGDVSYAARPFAAPMQVGQTFRARIDNNAIQNGGRIAVDLQNAAGEWLWYFDFVGGADFYTLSDQSTTIPYTDQGLEIAVTLTSPTTYSATITPLAGSPQTLTGDLRNIADQTVTTAVFLNQNAGFDEASNFYFNDIAIVAENPPGPATCSDTVTVVRGPLPPVTVRINEFMASNGSTVSDEDGDFEDWIELYNYGTEPVSLAGFGLTDNPSNPFKWVFPDITLAPGEYRLVWASGKDRRPDDHDGLTEGILRQVYNNIPGILVSDLTSHPSFPDNPTSQGVITAAFEAPQNVGDNYGQRMHGFIRAHSTGNYRFYIASDDASELWLSTDTDPDNAVLIASVPDWTEFRQWNKYEWLQHSAEISLVADQLYYISALMKEGFGGDHLSVGWSFGQSFNRPISGQYLFTPAPAPLHTSWSISAAGEPLQLTDPFGNIVDFVDAVPVPRDISYGRSIADPDVWLFFDQPTPGSANTSPGFSEILPPPIVSTPAGVYTSPVSVSVSPGSDGAVIRYTLDGSEPTESSPILSDPLTFGSRAGTPNGISLIPTNEQDTGAPFFEGWEPPAGEVFKIHTLRLRSFKPGAMPSPPLTQSYLIDPAGADRYSLPIVSVATDAANFFDHNIGIYVRGAHNNYFQRGSEWERPGSVEFFEPDGTPGFNIQAGIRIHGGTTRSRPRKSLRIYARNPSTLSYPLFPTKPVANYDTFILRNSGNDWGHTVFRDAFMQSLVAHSTLDYQHARPAIVFVNGEYWGIHTIRDRFDDGYYEHHYGLDDDEFTQLQTAYSGITEVLYDRGNPDLLADYLDLQDFIDTQGVVSSANYEAVADRMDIDNYIEHYTAQIYFGNTDWPGNNMRKWRSVESNRTEGAPFFLDGRWRWILFDTDFGFGLEFFYVPGFDDFANHDTLAYAASPVKTEFANDEHATLVFRRMLESAEFQRAFVTRFSDQLNTAFSSSRVLAEIDAFEAVYGAEMAEHVHRWRQPYNWASDLNRMRSYAMQRTDAVWGHLQSYFSLAARVDVTVDVTDAALGSVHVNTMDLATQPGVGNPAFPWTGSYFPDYPVTVTALPADDADFVAWVDGAQQVVSTDPDYTFMPAGAPALTAQFQAGTPISLLHYWNFNDTANLLTPTFTLGGGAIDFTLASPAAVTSGTGQDFFAENARFDDPAGAHLRVNDPTGAVMFVEMPTTGYEEILVMFETRRSGSGAGLQVIDYTTDGTSWQNFSTNPIVTTPVLTTLDFTEVPGVADNADFALRYTFLVGEGGEVGNNRFDNFTVEGRALPGVNAPPVVSNPVGLETLIEGGAALQIDLDTVFDDPDNDPLSFAAVPVDPAVVSVSLSGSLLTITPLLRGDTMIALEADDGFNPPAETSFRVLVYPEAAVLADGDFTFAEWDADEPAGSFPEHMLFLQSDTSDPDLTDPLAFAYRIPFDDAAVQPDDADFPYAASSRTRINGLGEAGISFINTGRGRDLGGALLALDTRGVSEAGVSWLGSTLLANTRVYAIRLQYRVGSDGPFLDVLDDNDDPVEYLRDATGHVTEFDPVELPATAIGEPYVQLLWRYYHISGDSGPRAQLRLDDIAVGADVAPPVFVSTYPTMFLRGTHNAWATDTPMALVADYTWEIEVAFGSAPDERFKFDAFGDWTVNWGDDEPRNGIGDLDGDNIPITEGEGVYRIVFNDDTKAYTVEKLDLTPIFLPGVTADWAEDINWSTGTYPDGIGAAAIVHAPLPDANRNVNIREPIVMGSILVDNAESTSRNRIRDRDTGNTLTFETTEPAALLHVQGDGTGFVEFEVEAGTILASDLELRIDNIEGDSDFGALRLRADWTGPGGLIKTGPGMASLTGGGKLYTGATTIEQGVLAVTEPAAMTEGDGISVLPGGQLRLTSSSGEGPARIYEFGGTLTLSGSGRTGVPEGEGMGILGAIRYEPGSFGNHAIVTSPVTLANDAGLHTAGLGNEMEFTGPLSGSHTITKTGGGALVLAGDGATFTGDFDVLNGALRIDGAFVDADVALDLTGSLQGSGMVGALSGSGLVEPGPGTTILNAASVNGLDYAFQFTQTGAPLFGNVAASGNDLLRLRGATPFVTPLNPGNTISIYLDVAELNPGDELGGGFFTDNDADFLASIENAEWQIFVADPDGGIDYEGQSYAPISPELDWTIETVPVNADFAEGTVEGRMLRLSFDSGLTGFPAWQANNFTPAELLDENISGPLADPDDTGIPNLERYAWGLNRNDPHEDALPRGAIVSDVNGIELLYIYRRLIAPGSGLAYLVESSDDILDGLSWQEAIVGVDIIDEGTATPTGDGVTEEVAVPLEQSTITTQRSMRVRLVLDPEP